MKKEKVTKLKTGHIEIRTTVEHDEVVTYKSEVLDRDVKAAEETVKQRESELVASESALATLKAIKVKVDKAK
jgi:hypothetical protein